MASLVFQVVDIFKKNTVDMMSAEKVKEEKIPTKRYTVKKSNNLDKWNHLIFSYKTFDTYKNRAIVFAKYCKKEFGIKQLNEITPKMTKAFFDKRIEEDKSAWTLHGDRAALVKLEHCLKERNWIDNKSSFVLSSKELKIPNRKLKNRKNRGLYKNSELDLITEEVSEATKKYIKFFRGTGARLKGASTIKKKDIDFKNNRLSLKEKGGYRRTISISNKFKLWLKDLVKEKNPENKVLPIRTDRSIQDQVRKACLKLNIKPKGVHRIRATFAYNMYMNLLKKGYSVKEAKKAVSEHLGHHRISVIKSYLPENA